MPEEILVNVTLHEVRVAFLSQDVVREIHVERKTRRGLAGNIYFGRIKRVMPELQAAFVDLGFRRPGFLHAKDTDRNLEAGDQFAVQVLKDSLGTKGPRLTTDFSLPGRWLVLTPGIFRMTVSQKITDKAEAARMLSLLKPGRFGGFIFRTMARYATLESLVEEQQQLETEWQRILERMTEAKPGMCLHREPDLECRVLRDIAGAPEQTRILVDDGPTLQAMKDYAAVRSPEFAGSLALYAGEEGIFDQWHAEKTLQQALQRRVTLKSGGYLVFDQTEAMITIDVNTGSSLTLRRGEETAFRINREAVNVIAREVRLRNLGGIIIIDFIDMADRAQQDHLLRALVTAFAEDTAYTEFSELTRLGLVQMTRKRARDSLLHTLCEPCPHCQRRGMVRTAATVAYDIVRGTLRLGSRPWQGFRIQLAPEVGRFLKEQEPEALKWLETRLGRTVELCEDTRYDRETWDILPL